MSLQPHPARIISTALLGLALAACTVATPTATLPPIAAITATATPAPVQQTTVTAVPPELTPTGTLAAQASAAPTETPRSLERLQATEDAATQAAATEAATATTTARLDIAGLHPALVKVCPSNPLVPLSQLGLDPATRLLLVPEQSEAYWDEGNFGLFAASPGAAIPKRISALQQPGQINASRYLTSPNGHWLLFERKATGSGRLTPWISSIDGTRQWSLSTDQRWDAYWLDDNTVMLSGEDEQTKEALNPFTLRGEELSDLPATQLAGIGALYFQSSEHTYLLYQSNSDYRLFTPNPRSDVPVLQWLRDDPAPFLNKGVITRPGGQLIIQVNQPYGFDRSATLSLADLLASSSYSKTMQPVVFPSEILTPSATYGYASDNSGMIVVGQDSPSLTASAPIYWLDFAHNTLRNFCFPTPWQTSAITVSTDNRFVALTWLHLPSTQPVPKTTYVLSLETGRYAVIDHFEFMAWGQAAK